MSTQPTVHIPSDTRSDSWGVEVSRRMHAENAARIDRKDERSSKRRDERRAKRK